MYDIDNIRDYQIKKKIGEGSFGDVYKGENIHTGEIVAIKIEKIEKTLNNKSRLDMEKDIYLHLAGDGIPEILWYGEYEDKKVLIMSYLGPSLEDLFDFCSRSFTYKTVSLIGIQILNRLEQIHSKGIIHRDIKPDNFLIGLGKNRSNIYMVDFGLSKPFIEYKQHIKYRNDKNFTGTYRYASIRNHGGIEQSRRDDLESLAYMLVYFCKGKLPWQGIQNKDKKKRSKMICSKKRSTSLEELCNGLPEEIYLFIKYCRLLSFTDTPKYSYLRDLLTKLIKKIGKSNEIIFDWNIIAQKKRAMIQN